MTAPGRRRTASALMVGLLLAGALLSGCDSDRRAISRDDLPDVDDPVATMTVDEDGFSPSLVTVEVGDRVLLRNDGERAHSFRSGSTFDTGLLEPGEQTVLLLVEAGELELSDRADPEARATIEVRTRSR